MKSYLSFDIGGTNVKWGLLNDKGEILKNDFFSSGHSDGETILRGMRAKINDHLSEIKGIAISAPGFIHPSGFIEKGGAIVAFDQFHLKEALEKEFSIPVSIENDVNCVALAEKWLGNGRDHTEFICLTVGTGIGGALFINNDLYRGHAFRGGEFGYMITRGLNSTLSLGDTLSAQASMTFVREKYAALHSIPLKEVTGERVFQGYDSKEPVAVQIVESFYQTLAIGIYNITSVLNPEKVLIGGGITSRPTFMKELRSHLTYVDRVFNVEIDRCYFKNDAGLVGALAFHLSKYPSVRNYVLETETEPNTRS
ncbi:beta-glucoside kinase [Salipaludibacillus keqinensis]|uniref:Beta-glucoside kinase n=1 Tax=Salipaludibacillus keqinensis TaxID=2045207 RepID=A0A323T785_9BACI|nr:ROK family protein [Salipaludibacillus keqinensis]PYZ91912.1 beta-glucoside kinase [Salipaludibacillus keqinensis]